ncbi:hypothetical protein FAVG1_13123 [Fusarium avenaceum]|nr:hypothetical protein FAVG1_13123 [Fusarium avenaceum]
MPKKPRQSKASSRPCRRPLPPPPPQPPTIRQIKEPRRLFLREDYVNTRIAADIGRSLRQGMRPVDDGEVMMGASRKRKRRAQDESEKEVSKRTCNVQPESELVDEQRDVVMQDIHDEMLELELEPEKGPFLADVVSSSSIPPPAVVPRSNTQPRRRRTIAEKQQPHSNPQPYSVSEPDTSSKFIRTWRHSEPPPRTIKHHLIPPSPSPIKPTTVAPYTPGRILDLLSDLEADTRYQRYQPLPDFSSCGRLSILAIVAVSLVALVLVHMLNTNTSISPEYRTVDWFQRALHLEVALASIPRVILFGEASQTQYQLQPGMLPSEGLPHIDGPIYGPSGSPPINAEWFSNHSDFPDYVPWVTTSAGLFVPERAFLHDLDITTTVLCLGLGVLGESGLPSFPLAHDPNFCRAFHATLAEFTALHVWEYPRLGEYYTAIGERSCRVMLSNLAFLLAESRNCSGSSIDLGSDAERTLTSTPRVVGDTRAEGIPEDYIQLWRQVMESRASPKKPSYTRKPQPHNSSHTIANPPSPKQYFDAQSANGTASYLLDKILSIIVDRPLDLKRDDIINDATYGNIISYADLLTSLYHMVLQLNGFLGQVLRASPALAHDIQQLSSRENRHSITRILQQFHEIAVFLDEVGIPRLTEMTKQAKRGAFLHQKIQQQQQELKRDIATIRSQGWVSKQAGRTIYHHLPSLRDMMCEIGLTQKWLLAEAEDLTTVFRGREAEFAMLHEEPSMAFEGGMWDEWVAWKAKVVWSRWSLNDSREHPGGEESFCLLAVDGQGEASTWGKVKTWFGGRGTPRWFRCGDASRRYG